MGADVLLGYPNGNMSGLYHSYAEANRIYNDTRISRIRSALFGEPSTSDMLPSRSTIVDKLTLPAQKTKDAVVRLLQFEGSTDVKYMGVPELIKMMCESDEALMAQAVHRVYLLSKEDRTIVSYPNLVDGLLRAARSDDPNVRRDAAGALSHLSEKKEGCIHIFRSGGLAELIRMLYNSVESVVHYAVTTLRNLLIYIPDVKVQARNLGAIDALSALLCRSNPKLLAQVVDSIFYLLSDDPQSRLVFLARGGPQTLLMIMKSFPEQRKLLYTVIRCIRTLSVCPQNKAALISLGCLPLLFNELCKPCDGKTKLSILIAIRNLSDAATNEENLSPLVVHLLDLLRESAVCPEPRTEDDIAGRERQVEASSMSACACGILSNLTCNNVRNKETICKSLGMEALLSAIRRFIDVEEITEPALCTIRHCTARHALSTQAQNELRICNSFPTILELLATFRTPVIKAALGVIRNAALLQANLVELTQVRIELPEGVQSIVSLTLTIFEHAVSEFREDPQAERDNVPMWGVIEGAVSALHQLAAHPEVASELYSNPNVLALISELLARPEVNQSEDEVVERELLGLVYQLSKTPEGARAVEMSGFTEQLMDALRSQHKSVSTYASGVLKNLQNDRPMHYRQDLDAELSSGWQRDGLEPELFGEMYPVHGMDSSHYQMTHNNSAWFDTDL